MKNSINNKYKSNEHIDESISSLALDWHIGESGCIVIIDKSGKILSDRDGHTGESLAENGIDLSKFSNKQNELFTSEVHGGNSFCIFSVEEELKLMNLSQVNCSLMSFL